MKGDERDEQGTEASRPAGPVGAGDPPPPAVAKASSGAVPPTPPPAGEAEEAQVEGDLQALLADTQRERDEYLDLARRTKADFENYRRRMSAEVAAAGDRGKAALIGELVHVIDNLERALEASGIDAGENTSTEDPLAKGILLTYNDLCIALKNNSVELLEPTGERFDPTLHEALTTKPGNDAEAGTVLETLQKGYRLGEQLIRPARVVVAE